MKCPKCGFETTSNFCPKCGMDLRQVQSAPQPSVQPSPNQINQGGVYSPNTNGFRPMPMQKKHSGLGIASFILSFLGPLAIVGLILAIVDLVKDKTKAYKHGLPIAAIVISCLVLLVVFSPSSSSKTDVAKSTTKSTQVETQEETKEETKETSASVEEVKTDGPQRIAVGEEFGNKTITGMVTYVDLDYKDYNDVWTTIDEGYKAVYIVIKVTNISDKSNYVSVGDFDCYVDNVATDPELISGGNEDYNANIDPGRSAKLGALYIVPEDAKNIELEYDPFGERAERQIIVIQDENTTEMKFGVQDNTTETKASAVSDDVEVVGIGDEFGNNTIAGVVTDADLDYKGYNQYWTTIDEGYKAIYITIKVTNKSDASNYVSVGDFDCYVDDVAVTAEMVTGGNEDYNANIDPGRSAILGAMYIIPEDAESIELEYDPIGESAKRVIIKIQ